MLRTWLVVVAILIASIGTLFGVTVSDLQLKLPFPDGETWVISEGYFGAFSHCITCSGGKDIYALDFNLAGSSDLGRPILAPASGQVIQATCDSEEKMARKEGYGCRVKISLAGGSYHYLVAHLITITVAVGDMVQQGQQLGLCGETGFTTGPHVHTALYPIVDGKEVTSVAPEPMSNYTNFIEYEVGVHDADGDGKYTSTNVLVNPAYVGYFSGNLDTGFVHDPNGTSARIAETHRQEAWRNGNLPLIPTNSGPYGVFVHPWDPWSDISIQDYRGTFPRSGAIVQKNDGILHTAAVHAGFWDVYVGNGGPGTFGYPITNEAQQSVSNLDCLNDKCVTQKFKGGTKGEGAFVYNPAWPPGSWPNGTVRWCDNANSNGNCQWNTTLANDSAAGSEIHAALISLSTGQTEDFTASASATFELRIASVSYNRIELGITSDVQNLDDIAIYVDGMQEAIIPPQAIGHAITNLTPGTTYSIVMHGLVDNVGTVVTSEPLEVTTLPSPQTTLRLTSGISAIGTAYPDEFLYDSCATVTFTIGNDGTSPIALDQVKALATIDFVGQTLTRDFSHANFSPPLVLNPGDTYTYVGDNCDNVFPGFAGRPSVPGVIKPVVKVNTVPVLWDITDVGVGAKWLNINIVDTHDRPNFVISGVSINPTVPYDGMWVDFDVYVTNIGTAISNWLTAEARLDGGNPITVPGPSSVGINETVRIGNVFGYLPAGIHHVSIVLDPNNNTWESREQDNSTSFFFTVSVPSNVSPGINLRPSQVITVLPANPTSDDSLTVLVTVNNIGVDAAGPSTVRLARDGGLGLWYQSVSSIAGGGSLSIPFSIGTLSAGIHTFEPRVDVNNDVVESDESDNWTSSKVTITQASTPPDTDHDGIPDSTDNCPAAANSLQADADSDGMGDACDPCPLDAANDVDADGVCGNVDNCPLVSNWDQYDNDRDGRGNFCDNCWYNSNWDQLNTDGDSFGDVCDNCPLTASTSQINVDGDPYGDICDCNSSDATVYPGASEICDGQDNNCNQLIDEGGQCSGSCTNPRPGFPLRLNPGITSNWLPSIAWSGSEFGVAQSTINVPTWDIRLTRYDGLGTSVTTTLAGNTSCSSYYPQLTWTGSEYGVIWADCTAANNDWEIYFSRLDRSGKKIGQDLRLTNAVGFSAYPSIAWNGDEYGFVWHDRRYDSGDILFARINRYGYKIGTDVRLTTHPSSSQSPFITWTGSEYGVTWYDYRDGNYEVYFTRMDRTGVKIGSDIRVTTNAYQSYNPVLSWNGNGYGISWYDTRNGSTEIYFAKLSPDGTKLTPDIRITNASDSSMYPSLSWTGSAYGLAWYDRRDGNNEIYFTMLDVNGVKLQIDQRLTTDAGNSQYPALRWTGSRFGLAWLDNRTGASEVYFTSITCN